MAHPPLLLLPILVAMAAAAPLAENVNKEQAVRVSGDVAVVDRAKRSKEVVAFDNQQNSEKLGLAKKSLQDPVDLPVAGLNAGQSSPLEDSADKTGVVFASEERMISPENKVDETEIREEVAGEDIAANNVLAPATLATAAVAGEESLSSAHHEAGQEASGEGHAVSEPEPEVAVLTQLPENSQSADAEEVFLGGQQQEPQVLQANSKDSDDVEEMLKELRVEDEPVQIEDESSAAENEKMTDTQLLHVAGNDENKDLTSEDEEYTKDLLKYVLMNGGRMPYAFTYPYIHRDRRSPSFRRFRPGLRYHRNIGGKQLARTKRTKRDLLDDDLYYNPDSEYRLPPPYDFPQDLADKETDLEELLPYLLALYPNLFEDPRLPVPEYPPGYAWEGPSYPEVENLPPPPSPEWEEEPKPVDPYDAPPEWEPRLTGPFQAEPELYPEAVESEDFYPTPAKRQMLSLVPGSRRKRYFWPVALEPYSHWGAFVPEQQKRGYYDDAYRRLRELSAVLGDGRKPSSSYLEALEDYRK